MIYDKRLLDNSEDIALSHDNVFILIQFYFCSGIFGIDYLIAGLNFHLDLLAVHYAAGAYCYDFRLLRFLFGLSGQYDAGFGCLLFSQLFQYNSVSKWC